MRAVPATIHFLSPHSSSLMVVRLSIGLMLCGLPPLCSCCSWPVPRLSSPSSPRCALTTTSGMSATVSYFFCSPFAIPMWTCWPWCLWSWGMWWSRSPSATSYWSSPSAASWWSLRIVALVCRLSWGNWRYRSIQRILNLQ